LKEHEAEVDVRIYVITVSTSRYEKYGNVTLTQENLKKINEIDDASGKLLIDEFSSKFKVVGYSLVPDDEIKILKSIFNAFENANVIITNGGTGLSPKDITIDTVRKIIEKEINGFGELFRKISYEIIGTSAMLGRTLAGTYKSGVIFCLPGSPNAVKIGAKIIMPTLKHILSHVQGLR